MTPRRIRARLWRLYKLAFREFFSDVDDGAAQGLILDLQHGLDEGDAILGGHEFRKRRAPDRLSLGDAIEKIHDVASEHFSDFEQPPVADPLGASFVVLKLPGCHPKSLGESSLGDPGCNT